MADKRTYNEKLRDKHGGSSVVSKHAERVSKDAKHQGPAKK